MKRVLRYPDLVERGIVNNRVTLANWIRDLSFPRGFLIGPNSRAWFEVEVNQWLADRPAASKPLPPPVKRRPGRPTNAERAARAAAASSQ